MHQPSQPPGAPSTAPHVPLLDLRAQYLGIASELGAAVLRVLESQGFIQGPEVEALERELAAYVGVEHAVAVANGTDALLLGLEALGIGPGDEVITTAYSFFATAGAILLAGATPVFVDIDPDSYNLDPGKVAEALGPRTRALMPVHLYGQCADMTSLLELARQAGVPVIEDAAQAIGARCPAGAAGAMGRLGCLSFYPSKNLGGIGDGGLILTGDVELAKRLRALRNHGQVGPYEHHFLGRNSRLDALNAAALRVKLPYLERWTEARRERAQAYRRLFQASGLSQSATGPAPVRLPTEDPGGRHVYHQFVVRIPQRDRIRAALQAEGIGTGVYYPLPIPAQPCLRERGYSADAFPQAAAAARETLALPIYPELTPAQQERVVDAIGRALRAVA